MPSGVYIRTKKRKFTEASKEKMRLAHLGRPTGRKSISEVTKEKIRTTLKQRYSEIKGDKHPRWKGNKVGYRGIHHWVVRELGRPNKCSHCGKVSDGKKEMEWANISGKYLRDISDWIILCRKCHRKMDKEARNNK